MTKLAAVALVLVFSGAVVAGDDNSKDDRASRILVNQVDNVIDGLTLIRGYDPDPYMNVVDCGALPTPTGCPSRNPQFLFVSFLGGVSPSDKLTLEGLEWVQIQEGGCTTCARHSVWRIDVRNDD